MRSNQTTDGQGKGGKGGKGGLWNTTRYKPVPTRGDDNQDNNNDDDEEGHRRASSSSSSAGADVDVNTIPQFDYAHTARVPLPMTGAIANNNNKNNNNTDNTFMNHKVSPNSWNSRQQQQQQQPRGQQQPEGDMGAPVPSSSSSSPPSQQQSRSNLVRQQQQQGDLGLVQQQQQQQTIMTMFDDIFRHSNNKVQQEQQQKEFRRQLIGEFIGTFILLYLGIGSIMAFVITKSLHGLFQVAAVWIFAVTIAIATVGPISGGHVNPAISLAFLLVRPSPEFTWMKFIPYCIVQIAGAALGAWVNYIMYSTEIQQYELEHDIVRSSINALSTARVFGLYYEPPVTMMIAFFTEVIGTAFLTVCVFALTHQDNTDTVHRNVLIAPYIGIVVGGLVCSIAPISSCGLNPARDLGPRIIAYFAGWTELAFTQAWLYTVAPLLGAPLGGYIADSILFGGFENDNDNEEGEEEKEQQENANNKQ